MDKRLQQLLDEDRLLLKIEGIDQEKSTNLSFKLKNLQAISKMGYYKGSDTTRVDSQVIYVCQIWDAAQVNLNLEVPFSSRKPSKKDFRGEDVQNSFGTSQIYIVGPQKRHSLQLTSPQLMQSARKIRCAMCVHVLYKSCVDIDEFFSIILI